jgi:hypothetical protein
MSNTIILEFAHKRIQELKDELRDMENIIEAFTPYDNEVCTEHSEGKMECVEIMDIMEKMQMLTSGSLSHTHTYVYLCIYKYCHTCV